jgi:hypothetical protein
MPDFNLDKDYPKLSYIDAPEYPTGAQQILYPHIVDPSKHVELHLHVNLIVNLNQQRSSSSITPA